MEFTYKRITERDKDYWSNDFDKTSYASLYERLQYLENKIEDETLIFLMFSDDFFGNTGICRKLGETKK